MHPFEGAGLGKAPFEVIQVYTSEPHTNCDFCATRIWEVHVIESDDGLIFKVGCECVKRTEDEDLIDSMAAAKAAKRRLDANEAMGLGVKGLASIAFVLKRQPHPLGFVGKTRYDFVVWALTRAPLQRRKRIAAELAPIMAILK